MISIWPTIPALFLVLLASYYSQNYAGILASPLAVAYGAAVQAAIIGEDTSREVQNLLLYSMLHCLLEMEFPVA